MRRNVLIFHNAALGDFLMTWPLARALGRMLATSRVIYVTAADKGRLAERLIGTEYSDIEAGWHGLYGDAEIGELPAKLLHKAQMAVVFSHSADANFEARLKQAAGEDIPVIHISPNPPAGVHVIDHQLLQLKQLPPLADGTRQMCDLITDRGLIAARQNGPVVIHPGSGASRKNALLSLFVECAKSLKIAGMDVCVLTGEVEEQTRREEILHAFESVAPVYFCPTLGALCDRLRNAWAYIGNDSGPTHLAAMLACRTVAMFGPTSDAVAWRPIGPSVKVLSFEASAADIVNAVTP